ncbi:MAG: hypothetical protein AB7F88_10605 [Pyrinomonadaceae bacterium]
MRNARTYTAIGALLTLVAAGFWFCETDAEAQATGSDTVISDKVVDGDWLAAGSNVQIQAEVKGDATVAGSIVKVTAPVGGYLLAAGSDVVVSGSVGNDLWAAGSNVTVGSAIGDNAMLAGATVTLQPTSLVAGDARIGAGRVRIQGPVGGDLMVSGRDVEIASEISGNVEANVGQLRVLPGSIIRGNLIVNGATPPEISPEAQVLGKVDFTSTDTGNSWLSWLSWWFFYFLVLLATGVVMLLISRVWAGRVATQINSKPLKTLLAGLIGLIVIPIIIVVLAITVIGLGVALVLLAIYFVFAILAAVYVAYTAGGWLLGLAKYPEASPWPRMIIGALVVSLLVSLPWVGWLIQLVVLILGFGAVMLERWDLRRQLGREGWA